MASANAEAIGICGVVYTSDPPVYERSEHRGSDRDASFEANRFACSHQVDF